MATPLTSGNRVNNPVCSLDESGSEAGDYNLNLAQIAVEQLGVFQDCQPLTSLLGTLLATRLAP